MGQIRQKRKNRSSRPKVRPRTPGRTKAGKKKVNFLGNETIAKNWDKSETLEQNYRRLGLSTKLKRPTGGREPQAKKQAGRQHDSLAISSGQKSATFTPEEVKVERDPATGQILRVVRQDTENDNPLDDPLNELDGIDDAELLDNTSTTRDKNNIIAKLEAEAAQEEVQMLRKRRPRQQSTREDEWMARLVEAHGNNTTAMFRDRKLNTMQQSEGDIARRLKKWQQRHG